MFAYQGPVRGSGELAYHILFKNIAITTAATTLAS
jgi:hypothetical protein